MKIKQTLVIFQHNARTLMARVSKCRRRSIRALPLAAIHEKPFPLSRVMELTISQVLLQWPKQIASFASVVDVFGRTVRSSCWIPLDRFLTCCALNMPLRSASHFRWGKQFHPRKRNYTSDTSFRDQICTVVAFVYRPVAR